MGPCTDLIAAADVLGCCSADQFDGDHPPSDALLAEAVSVASTVAWRLAGRRHGACEIVGERPAMAAKRRCCTSYRPPYRTGCGCGAASTVWLGNSPVQSIDDVRVSGESLDVDAYRLIRPNRLIRVDGGRWPSSQRLADPDDGDGVLVVDYTWGVPVDDDGRRAIGVFACELVKACLDKPCQLPERVTSITRQGVSLAILDPMDFLSEGRTGVYEFDLWLHSVNPGRLNARSRVRSPDIIRAAHTAAAGGS